MTIPTTVFFNVEFLNCIFIEWIIFLDIPWEERKPCLTDQHQTMFDNHFRLISRVYSKYGKKKH